MARKNYPVAMEVAGNTAIWTRPDCGDSPCSYPAPTYSAVRALFESVLWGPAVIVIPRKVELCSAPVFHSYATNYGGPLRQPKDIKENNNRQMFATVLLDVCYRLYADVVPNPNKDNLPESARKWDGATTSPGHAYATLSLGWSEFTVSYFGPFRESTHVCAELPDIHIPSMLRSVFNDGYRSQYRAVYDTDVVIHGGVLEFPRREDCP